MAACDNSKSLKVLLHIWGIYAPTKAKDRLGLMKKFGKEIEKEKQILQISWVSGEDVNRCDKFIHHCKEHSVDTCDK